MAKFYVFSLMRVVHFVQTATGTLTAMTDVPLRVRSTIYLASPVSPREFRTLSPSLTRWSGVFTRRYDAQ